MRTFYQLLAAILLIACPQCARADYPERAVHVIVALPPGGSVDVVARILADKIGTNLGEPVVVENRPGASGIIAAQSVSAANPDGYTVLFTTSAVTTSPWMSPTSFDPVKDLKPVTLVARTAYVLIVRPSLGVNSLDEFIALAKAEPGKMNCSTYGVGSPPHLALELLKDEAGIDFVHIPYRGFGQALPDLMSGLLSCAMEIPANIDQQVKVGNVKAIAVTTAAPFAMFPGVTTIASRYPKVVVDGWQGAFVPAGTPPEVVDRLNTEFVKALRDPTVVKRLRELGFEPIGNGSAEATAIFKDDYERFGATLRDLKLTP
jgi:tripartite-type tricarboxylate transporter receptor subunit TctC